MIKKALAVLLAAATAASFASCGGKDIGQKAPVTEESSVSEAEMQTTDESLPEEEEAPEPLFSGELKAPAADEKIDLSQGATENMLIRSVLNRGDTRRLAQKLRTARELTESTDLSGPEKSALSTKIAFLGDSVTTGYNASGDKKFASRFEEWWDKNFSFYAEWNNAGVIATDSYLGVHRVDSDVLYNEPDIIFIEFINDENTDFYKKSMDSLLRKCLSMPNMPAVILIEMTWSDGSSPQEIHYELAEKYGVPVISVRDAVLPEIDAGNIAWNDIFADDVHPNDRGHELIAQMLTDYVSSVADEMYSVGEPEAFKEESPTGDKFRNAAIADIYTDLLWVAENNGFDGGSKSWNFQNGWGTITGGDITFMIECKNLGLLYNMTTDGEGGVATITVDDVKLADIDSDFSNGWGEHTESIELFEGKKKETHWVTVSVPKGKRFEVLRWLIS